MEYPKMITDRDGNRVVVQNKNEEDEKMGVVTTAEPEKIERVTEENTEGWFDKKPDEEPKKVNIEKPEEKPKPKKRGRRKKK